MLRKAVDKKGEFNIKNYKQFGSTWHVCLAKSHIMKQITNDKIGVQFQDHRKFSGPMPNTNTGLKIPSIFHNDGSAKVEN